MMLVLALSLFFTEPAPLDMPRAEAYLVKEKGEYRLEDRYNRLDLWTSQAVIGRWMDEDGRIFSLSSLAYALPARGADEVLTRSAYVKERVKIDKRDFKRLRWAVEALSPVSLPEKGEAPRQLSRGYKDIDYWHGTNRNAIVCAFLPEKGEHWFLAVWELAAQDEHDEMLGIFTKEFLEADWRGRLKLSVAGKEVSGERELLRRDAKHSVAAYERWRCTDAEEFSILDELPYGDGFITALTNDMTVMRGIYSKTIPSPINSSNVLCVVRVYADRESYIEAAGEDMSWSAAYWNPLRRELVAYLPDEGESKLIKTIRHEAFHQYLSYACSMLAPSPWLNEGYAQYFENDDGGSWGEGMAITPQWIDAAAPMLFDLFKMDYAQFYSGTDEERHLKYRLAWSVAYFIEKGAHKVRFNPFENLKRGYMSALLETRDMHKATERAFGDMQRLKKFVEEWKRFWKKN
jgi:hypothetical protein